MMSKKTALSTSALLLAGLMYLPTASAVAYDYTETFVLDENQADSYYGTATGVTEVGGAWDGQDITKVLAAIGKQNPAASFDFKFEFTPASGFVLGGAESLGIISIAGSTFSSITGTDALGTYTTSHSGGTYFANADLTIAATNTVELFGKVSNGNNQWTIAYDVAQGTPSSSVPEPEQFGMLLLGLPLISMMVRRKQSA